jgi:hypothetical protein
MLLDVNVSIKKKCLKKYKYDSTVKDEWKVTTVLKNRLISDWSVKNTNPDVTPNRMLLDFIVCH